MAAPNARDSLRRREAGTALVSETARHALFPLAVELPHFSYTNWLSLVSGLSPLGLYRASAREKINHQNDERDDDQNVNQAAAKTA